MSTINDVNLALNKLNFWLKLQDNDDIMLGDITSIIAGRWYYIRDNWSFLKKNLLDTAESYKNPDFLISSINEFTDFIDAQRNNSAKINPFTDIKIVNRFLAIFDNMQLNSIELSNDEVAKYESYTATVENMSRNDFLDIRNIIITYRDRYTDTIGLQDADYNSAFKRNSIQQQINATIVDINYIQTLQDSVQTVDFILSNLFAVDNALDPFALARANANNPEVDIGQYYSGTLVKLNYGESLQQLANRYLGNPDKWIDIAIANGLKPPYIDEIGTRLPLLSNGNSNLINIAENDGSGQPNINKFYINQPIFIQSDNNPTVNQRTIINIKQIPVSGEIILELSGDSNLSIYTTTQNAHIRIFQPNTINSMFYILIPSTEQLADPRKDDVPWFLAKSSNDEKLMKVDLNINEFGDLSFATNGDCKLSYGFDNAIQAIKLKIITEAGELIRHPEFGLINVVGQKNNDIDDVINTMAESITNQIEQDSRFDRIDALDIDYIAEDESATAAAYLIINMSVKMAGGDRVIPISFNVNVA